VRQDIKDNVEYHLLEKEHLLDDMLANLFDRNIQSLIVEGGAQTIKTFLSEGLWDEARVFTSGQRFKSGIGAPIISKAVDSSEMIEGDELNIYSNT
jgi:diaminohydroxyphosphoribosylaminopyrimidine deaminase/5-amino-6-(5-phosphoribosylamino)uracil reductase